MAPATIGAMPGIAMGVLSATLPASSGCPDGDVNSSTTAFLPGFHCPVSLLSVITASLVFWVCMVVSSALQAVVPLPAPRNPPASAITAISRFIDGPPLFDCQVSRPSPALAVLRSHARLQPAVPLLDRAPARGASGR